MDMHLFPFAAYRFYQMICGILPKRHNMRSRVYLAVVTDEPAEEEAEEVL